MIRRKNTGTSEELAKKLDISERWLYKFLGELKEEFDCPIVYDSYRQSYIYEEKGEIVIVVGFENLSDKQRTEIGGGFSKKIRPLYLFVQ